MIPPDHLASLERWLVREYVARELDAFIRTPDFDSPDSFVAWLFQQLLRFPPFLPNAAEIEPLLKELFYAATTTSTTSVASGQSSSSVSFLRTYLAPLISGPILSACRAVRQQQRSSSSTTTTTTNNPAAETAAGLLHELSQHDGGLDDLLDEIAAAHSIAELRPTVQHWVDQIEQEARSELGQGGFSPTVERFLVEQLPRRTLMAMLKSHSATSATSCAMKFLFFRTSNTGVSFFHQAVSEALQIDLVERQLASLPLSAEERQAIDLTNNSGSSADVSQVTHKYLALRAKRERAQRVLAVFQDQRVVELIMQLVQLTKANTMDLLFAKGSGMVKLVEDALVLVDDIVARKSLSREDSTNALVHRVWLRVLALLHNVLLAQSNAMLVRDTLQWYFEWFKLGLSLDLDWASGERLETVGLAEEAKVCFDREVFNAAAAGEARSSKSTRIPRPTSLPVTERVLLPMFGEALLRAVKGRGPIAQPPHVSLRSPPTSMPPTTATTALQHLEVVFTHSEQIPSSNLLKRGFVRCGYTKSASIWAHFGGGGGEPAQRRPITDIQLVTSEAAAPAGYTVVLQNLNKGAMTGDKLFLCYTRGGGEEEGRRAVVRGVEILQANADERKQLALKQCGYAIASTFASGVFASSHFWVLKE